MKSKDLCLHGVNVVASEDKMKKHRSLVSLFLCVSFLLSACTSVQLFEPTPTPLPITNLTEAYKAAVHFVLTTDDLPVSPGTSPSVVEVIGNYDVTDSISKWSSASFIFRSFVDGNAKYLGVTVTLSGTFSLIEFDPASPYVGSGIFQADLFGLLINNYDEKILADDWSGYGSAVDANCGPVTNIKYHLTAVEQTGNPEPIPTWEITYNGQYTSMLGYVNNFGFTDIGVLDRDEICPPKLEDLYSPEQIDLLDSVREMGKIIFYSDSIDTDAQIYSMNPDGSDLRPLTKDGVHGFEPDCSPDGQLIIAIENIISGKIFTINIDGTDINYLPGIESTQSVQRAKWSPDGKKIVYVIGKSLYTINIDGADKKELLSLDSFGFIFPVWISDGQIAFLVDLDGESKYYVIDSNGSNQSEITKESYEEHTKEWSPDKTAYLISPSEITGPDIILYKADDSISVPLLEHEHAETPTWCP
jgi:hypothetical protein